MLAALWEIERGTVALVADALNDLVEPEVSYSTVLTMLRSLYRKGLVDRDRHGPAHVYWASVRRQDVLEDAVERLVNTYFGYDERELLALVQAREAQRLLRREKRLSARARRPFPIA